MILAAGRGERLRPITDTLPKPLVEVAGRTLIERHMERLVTAGVDRVIINLGWLGEQIADRLGGGTEFGVTIVYSPEYDQVLDSGGGVCRALPLLGSEPFWVLNADILTDFVLPAIPLANDADGELILVDNPTHKRQGDFGLRDGRVTNEFESGLTFSGIARYRPEFFRQQQVGRFSIVPLLRAAADAGRLRGLHYSGYWADVGTPERLAAIGRECRDD